MSNSRNGSHNEVNFAVAYIDLTSSPAQNLPIQRNAFSDSVIEILEDSFVDLTYSPQPTSSLYRQTLQMSQYARKKKEKQGEASVPQKSEAQKSATQKSVPQKSVTQKSGNKKCSTDHIGACAICFDEYGTRPLTSTICGHVYCSDCFQRAFRNEKKCPTCRKNLNGRTDCHPLYLQLN